MYSYISGTLRGKTANAAIVDNNGIGYKIHSSVRALDSISLEERVTFYTHLYIREDEMSLYGFPDAEGVALFELLLSVSGIGPKAALSICSAGSTAEVYGAIVTSDIGRLTKVPGIGKKTAERLVLELKEKISRHVAVEVSAAPTTLAVASGGNVEGQALTALLGLGYQEQEVASHIKQTVALLGPRATLEDVLRAVLKMLAGGR